MSRRIDKNGCPIDDGRRGKRKGRQVYYYFQELLGVTVLVAIILFVARGQGWASTATDPTLARWVSDDIFLYRAIAWAVVFIVLMVIVGKPADKNPSFTSMWRGFGILMCIAFIALFAWYGWGQ